MVNDIAVFNDDTIYLAHTSNSLIYQLTPTGAGAGASYSSYTVVGQSGFHGNLNNTNGKQALIKQPRNIIKNRLETELFFIDDNKYIKNVKIQSDSIIGTVIEILTSTTSTNIYDNYGFNYASSEDPTNYIYFSSKTCLYKVYIDSKTVTTKSTSLSIGEFVDISFYDSNLYYCYKSNIEFIFKKSSSSITYDLINDESFTIQLDSKIENNVKGFSITSNLLLVLGSNAIQSFKTVDYITFTSNNLKTMSENFTALIDYKAIYKDNCNFVIGRRSDYKNFYKINTDTLEIDTSSDFIVNMRTEYSINVLSQSATGDNIINNNIIYNNINLLSSEDDDNIILHYNEQLCNIQKIKCTDSKFKTNILNFTLNSETHNFTNIIDIAINNLNTLYIANTSNIYKIDITTGGNTNTYELQTLQDSDIITDGSSIKSLYYSDANLITSSDFLHYVTTKSYNEFNLITNSNTIFSNIIQTDNTDSLTKFNDFVIDNNYEIGYMAFEDRLKWFYL